MKTAIKIQTSSEWIEKHVPLKAHKTKTSQFYQLHQPENKTNFALGPNPEEKEEV